MYKRQGLLSTPTVGGQERVFVPLASAQVLFGMGDRLTVVQASLAPGADRTRAEASIKAALGSDYTCLLYTSRCV